MKIVHICMSQYSDGWTYQENLLTKYHRKLGYNVSLITSMYCYKEGVLVEDTNSSFIDVNGTKIIRLKKKSEGLMKKIPSYIGFYEALSSEKPDIIFSHGCQYKDAALVAKYIKNHPDVRLYVDNHADFSNSATNFFSKNILHKVVWRHYAQKMLPYTICFWGVLPARVDFLTDVYSIPKEKCKLLVMGADDELVDKSDSVIQKNALRQKYGIKKDDFLIVTGGKIDKAKLQTELLMKAVLNITNPNVKLLLFGSIEDDIKERIMKLVDGRRIIYVGWITPNESYDYFAIANFVVFPGRHSVFWEQVAGQGIPLLVKDWKGTHHINLCDNAIIINDITIDTLNREISTLISNPDTYKRLLDAAKCAKSNFSYLEIAKKSIGDII